MERNEGDARAYMLRAAYTMDDQSPVDREKRLPAAERDSRRALEIAPDDPDALRVAADIALRRVTTRLLVDDVRTLLHRRVATAADKFPWYSRIRDVNTTSGSVQDRAAGIAALRDELAAVTEPEGVFELKWMLADALVDSASGAKSSTRCWRN